MENERDSIKRNRAEVHAFNVIKGILNIEGDNDSQSLWRSFRNALVGEFDNKEIMELWKDEKFRWGSFVFVKSSIHAQRFITVLMKSKSLSSMGT